MPITIMRFETQILETMLARSWPIEFRCPTLVIGGAQIWKIRDLTAAASWRRVLGPDRKAPLFRDRFGWAINRPCPLIAAAGRVKHHLRGDELATN